MDMGNSLTSEKGFCAFDFANLPIGVYCVAPNGDFFFANRSVRQLLGLPLKGSLPETQN